MSSTELIDRENEARELRALAQAGKPKMALLYGRRRVGKTFLLSKLWSREEAFYFIASAVSPDQNRRRLVEEFGQWLGRKEFPEDYPTWRAVFRLLLQDAARPGVIVLDEFQYLAQDEREIAEVTSELNAVWEGRPGIKGSCLLVLSGSSIRMLERLDHGGAPLYGRISWKGRLEPFDYLDAARVARMRSLRETAIIYGTFGGTPQYLQAVEPSKGLGATIAAKLLSPRGEVRMQLESTLLQEEGLRDVQKYQGILNAIGSGRSELSLIADRVGLDKHNLVREKVETLEELGWVERSRNFGAGPTSAWRYRIADPALRFYYTFVTKYHTALGREQALDIWTNHIGAEIDTYMGHVFERIVQEAYVRISDEPAQEWSRWEGKDRERQSVEIDIVSRLLNGKMLTGAIKWNARPIGLEVHKKHMDQLNRLAASGQGWAREALGPDARLIYVAAGGFKKNFLKAVEEGIVPAKLWTLKDFYSF